jgi:uncharacterized membrane protein
MNNKFDEPAKDLARSVTRRTALKKFGLGFAGLALACFGLAGGAAGSPTFTSIDFPGAGFTVATDINNNGQITGWYIDSIGYHGFLLNSGTQTSVNFPGAAGTAGLGISPNGDIVGAYSFSDATVSKNTHGFVVHGGVFTSIDVPGAVSTRATGINLAGDIVGIYADKLAGKDHGFLLRGGVITPIDFPGAAITELWKINNAGEIVGRYVDTTDDKSHIFKLSNGVFVSVGDFPGAVQTAPAGLTMHHGGLNGARDIVNVYTTASPVYNVNNDNVLSNAHGFLLSGGVYTSIEFPGAIGTISYGINDSGLIVGGYADTNEQAHGYLRTP